MKQQVTGWNQSQTVSKTYPLLHKVLTGTPYLAAIYLFLAACDVFYHFGGFP